MRLRELRQPICLFGEDPMDRRERLRNCIIQYYIDNGREPTFFTRLREEEKKEEEAEVEEKFYTEGPEELKAARLEFAKYSIPRSNARIMVEKLKTNQLTSVTGNWI